MWARTTQGRRWAMVSAPTGNLRRYDDGISMVKMVKVDDVWLVQAHRFLGEGEGSG